MKDILKNNLGNLVENLLNFCSVLLLIYGVLLFDSLEIIVYKTGIVSTDFSGFFNLSKIPFLLLFLTIFGIIAASLSSLIITAVFWLWKGIVFIGELLETLVNRFFCVHVNLTFKSEQKADLNLVRFLFDICANNECMPIKLFLILMLILVVGTIMVGIWLSTKNEFMIPFPYAKYVLLLKEKELLLSKK